MNLVIAKGTRNFLNALEQGPRPQAIIYQLSDGGHSCFCNDGSVSIMPPAILGAMMASRIPLFVTPFCEERDYEFFNELRRNGQFMARATCISPNPKDYCPTDLLTSVIETEKELLVREALLAKPEIRPSEMSPKPIYFIESVSRNLQAIIKKGRLAMIKSLSFYSSGSKGPEPMECRLNSEPASGAIYHWPDGRVWGSCMVRGLPFEGTLVKSEHIKWLAKQLKKFGLDLAEDEKTIQVQIEGELDHPLAPGDATWYVGNKRTGFSYSVHINLSQTEEKINQLRLAGITSPASKDLQTLW